VFASTVAVAFFLVLLGFIFLPSEARKLNEPGVVAITHHLPAAGGQPAVSLFFHSSLRELRPRNYWVVVHDRSADRTSARHPWPELQPRCIARGAAADLFVGNSDGSVYLLNLQNPAQPPILIGRDAGFAPAEIAASKRGRWVVTFDWVQIWAWNAAQRTLQWKLAGIDCFALRPGADTLICCTRSGELNELELETGGRLRSLGCQPGEIRNLAISPDGQLLALLHAPTGMSVRNLNSARLLWQAESGSAPNAGAPVVQFSPCGRLLVSASPHSPHELAVWDAHTGDRRRALAGHRQYFLDAAFGADGMLYSWGLDGTIRAWDAWHGLQIEVLTNSCP
jgi:WD40 repeat protein